MTTETRDMKIVITADDKTGGAVTQVNKDIQAATNSTRSFNGALGNLTGSLFNLQNIIAAIGIGYFTNEVLEAGIVMQKMDNSLKAVTGSTKGAKAEFAYIRKEAEYLGLNLERTAKDYTKLAAASKGTSLEGQATRDIFESVAEASTVLGLSTEESSGALTAIQQIMSKGTVQAEELRGQLGERLPGAFQIASRAMNMTTQELGKQLQLGRVTAEDFLPKFAQELRKTYAGALPEAINSAQANLNRFETTIFNIKTRIAASGFMEGIIDALDTISRSLDDPDFQEAADEAGRNLAAIASGLADIVATGPAAVKILRDMANMLNLQSPADLAQEWTEYQDAFENLMDVFTGRRDWQTGEIRPLGFTPEQFQQAIDDAQRMIEHWKKNNATPGGWLMDWVYGEDPLTHWTKRLDWLKTEFAKAQTVFKQKIVTPEKPEAEAPVPAKEIPVISSEKYTEMSLDKLKRREAREAEAAKEAANTKKQYEEQLETLRASLQDQDTLIFQATVRRDENLRESREKGLLTQQEYNDLAFENERVYGEIIDQRDEERATRKQERFAAELESTRAFLADEEDLLFESTVRRDEILQQALEQGLISQATYNALSLANETNYQDQLTKIELKGLTDRQKFEKLAFKARLAFVAGQAAQMTASVANTNRAMFEINKWARVAEAAMELKAGVSKTFNSYAYPWNIAMAGLHAAVGASYIASLVSSSFGETTAAYVTPGAGAVPSQQETITDMGRTSQTEETERPYNINVYVSGYVRDTDELARDLMESIRKQTRYGA